MKCLIICSSCDIDWEFLSNTDTSEYFVICADGGMDAASKIGLVPDLWVGDMDSVNGASDIHTEKIIYPSDKDLSDSHIAVNEALKRGYKDIFLVGATGGRLDHEYANYCLLKYILKSGGFGIIINKNNRVFMAEKDADIEPFGMKYISFFPFGGTVSNFSAENVKYELKNHLLSDDDTYTVSNEFVDNKPAKISFKAGLVLIICSNDI